jgi:hypothetical protein
MEPDTATYTIGDGMSHKITPVVPSVSIALLTDDKWLVEKDKEAAADKVIADAGVVMADCLAAVKRGREYIDDLCDRWAKGEFSKARKDEDVDG